MRTCHPPSPENLIPVLSPADAASRMTPDTESAPSDAFADGRALCNPAPASQARSVPEGSPRTRWCGEVAGQTSLHRQAELDGRRRKFLRVTHLAVRGREPRHLGVKPHHQQVAAPQGTAVARPVRRAEKGHGRAHMPSLNPWLTHINPQVGRIVQQSLPELYTKTWQTTELIIQPQR